MKDSTKMILGVAVLSSLIALSSAVAANAQARNCGPRTMVVERLAEGYRETRQSIGMAANNVVVEVFASVSSGSWTIVVTQPTGISCLVASGQGFENLSEDLPPPGDPT